MVFLQFEKKIDLRIHLIPDFPNLLSRNYLMLYGPILIFDRWTGCKLLILSIGAMAVEFVSQERLAQCCYKEINVFLCQIKSYL